MYIVTLITPKAKAWIDDNAQVESWQRICGGFAVDHHFIEDLIDGIVENELLPVQDFDVMHFGG